jgi:capsular exopolysaccharide synthesis family protein
LDEPSLRDTLAALRRRRRIIVVCLLLGAGIALALSLVETPRYRAETDLLLKPTTSADVLAEQTGQVHATTDAQRALNNEIRLIESQSVRDAVDRVYDGRLDVDDVTAVAPASDTDDVITIQVTSTDPDAAAKLVDAYADTYIAERRTRQVDDLTATAAEIQTRLDATRQQLAAANGPLDSLDAQIAAASPGSDRLAALQQQRSQMLSQIQSQTAPLQARETALETQLQQLQVTQDLAQAGSVTVLSPAEVPDSPVSPRTVRNVAAGALIGLLVGVVLALLRDHLDDSVSTKEQVEQLTGLPTLGLIPKGEPSGVDLASVSDPSSTAAEAYRALRTSVKFLGLGGTTRTVLVTSASASEGKTVTAVNLAVVLAQAGERVLLVGADLRRPRIHDLFGTPRVPGLTNVLLGETTAESATYAVQEVPRLHVLPPGPTPPNPAELLDSTPARALLSGFATRYDRVVIDSPPVLPVTDAQVLTRAADGVLLVVAYRETSRRGLARAVEMLGQVAAPVLGTVLNLVPVREGYGGEPYRYETYRSRSERRRQRETPAHVVPAGAHGTHIDDNGHGTDPRAASAFDRVPQEAAPDEPR